MPRKYFLDTESLIDEIADNLKSAWLATTRAIEKAQTENENYCNAQYGTSDSSLRENMLVLLRSESNLGSSKFQYKWLGPFLIKKILSPNVIITTVDGGGNEQTVHLDRLKGYHSLTPFFPQPTGTSCSSFRRSPRLRQNF